MRALFLVLTLLPVVALAQTATPDPLNMMLPSGRVVHFETAEAKAKFEAAQERRRQALAAQPTLSPHMAAPMGQTSLDQPASGAKYSTYYRSWNYGEGTQNGMGHTHDALSTSVPSLSVAQVQANAFSLQGTMVEVTRIRQIETQEVAAGKCRLTIWARSGGSYLIAYVSAETARAAVLSGSLIVTVSKPQESGSEITLLGNAVAHEALSSKAVPVWR